MRGLNATNAMSQGLIKTSSALLQRSRHTQMHLCDSHCGLVRMDGASKLCSLASLACILSETTGCTKINSVPFLKGIRMQ